MIYPLSYWKKGDLVVLEGVLHHFRNHIFVYMRPHPPLVWRASPVAEPAAVLYCINDGTTVYMRARYLREPKKNNET